MDSANLEEILTCGICQETFEESFKLPRILYCGHSFCHFCLVKLLAQSPPSCPTCKAEILFEKAGSIPINFSLKSLINIGSQILMKNSSTNLDGDNSNPRKKVKLYQRNSKYLSEGYCDEHETYKGIRCMDCEVWICGMCAILKHKQCKTLLVQEAYKEMKNQVSQKVEEELGQRKTRTELLTESLRELEEDRKSLIEEIKCKELELKDREKRIQELESLKTEENKFCDKLKKLQTMVDNSAKDPEFSKNLIELEKLLEEGKKQIPVCLPARHLPQRREAFGPLCQNRSVYVVEERYAGTRYGKVALKDGRILVASFQQVKPEDATLFSLPELLSRFNNGFNDLPKTVFLRVTPDGGRVDSFEVIIETDGLTPRAKNFILFCSALKGPSYKRRGICDLGDSSGYAMYAALPPVFEGIRDDVLRTPQKEGGVYGMGEGDSWFRIQLEDQPSRSLHKFGVVVAGLQQLKELRERDCSIEECGLVI